MPLPRTLLYVCGISRALVCEPHLFSAIFVEQLQMYPRLFGIHDPLPHGWDAQGLSGSLLFSQREPLYSNGQIHRNPGGQKCIF